MTTEMISCASCKNTFHTQLCDDRQAKFDKAVVEFQTSNKSEPRGYDTEKLFVCIVTHFTSKKHSFMFLEDGSIASDDLLEVLDVNFFNADCIQQQVLTLVENVIKQQITGCPKYSTRCFFCCSHTSRNVFVEQETMLLTLSMQVGYCNRCLSLSRMMSTNKGEEVSIIQLDVSSLYCC